MEFEFDKEIDAILRKAREGDFAFADNLKSASRNLESVHLDADEIAAFAENALPEKSKTLYTRHFAECDRCRRILSNLIALNAETAMVSVSSDVSELIAATTIPWYRKLFVMPNLAYTMGAFVLVFGGFLGVLVLQNSGNKETAMSSATETQQKERGPNYNQDTGLSAANANSAMSNAAVMNTNTASSAANAAANTAANVSASNSATSISNRTSINSSATAPRETDTAKNEEMSENQPLAFATPPPATITQSETARDDKNKGDDEVREQNRTGNAAAAPAPPPPPAPASGITTAKPKKKISEDEAKLSAPRSSATASKKVGGKTFERRNDAWIDTEYRADIMLRHISRGSNDYQKLDGGLKNIAENLGGTVIIIWKSKGYRIQ